jgi:hypothetical protein
MLEKIIRMDQSKWLLQEKKKETLKELVTKLKPNINSVEVHLQMNES